MATKQRSSKTRRILRCPEVTPDGAPSSEHPYGVPIHKGLHEAIEAERDSLSQVESLLACMVISLEYHENPLGGPYFPAVAQLARDLVARSIDGLDPSVLRQRLLRNKIEEVHCASLFIHASVFEPADLVVNAYRNAA